MYKTYMQKVLIIDFGSQVTQLIARRVRELGVYSEIHPYHVISLEFIDKFSPKAIILSGGPASVEESKSPEVPKEVFHKSIPILGICYGQQLMCKLLGGRVQAGDKREFGQAFLSIKEDCLLFDGIWEVGSEHEVWMSHGDHVHTLPKGFKAVAVSEGAPYAAVANEELKCYGVQFHPEVTHTPHGLALIKNFLYHVAGCAGDWNMHNFLDNAVEGIRRQVDGKEKVICAVSGGVDSTVVAALVHRAIGERLTCIFVDTGLLRKNEGKEVEKAFKERFHIPITCVDASKAFLKALKGVSDPEKKRKIIGKVFIEVFEKEAKKIGGATYLAQGTLYPDVIESVPVHGAASSTIKSHHNVGGLPQHMKMKLIEPVRELFKDEVRMLGMEMGMDITFIKRHPFPGPGLAIRIPGEITQEKLDILKEADAIYLEEISNFGLYDMIWQAFAVLLPVKTVGVMGDARTYEYVCALRAVTSLDGMTADFFAFPSEFLRKVSTRIVNHVRGINRIVYDITSKPPGTIEWE